MKKSRIVAQLVGAVVATCAVSAQAVLIGLGDANITLSGGISGLNQIGHVGWNYGGGLLTWEYCYSGAFSLSVQNPQGTPTDGSMLTFCTDVGVNWVSGRQYTAMQFSDGQAVGVAPPWSHNPEAIQNASWIYNQYYIPTHGNLTANEASAIQLAIWKVLYETQQGGELATTSFSAGRLEATDFGGIARAGEILTALINARNGGTFTTYFDTWLRPNHADSQGMIYNPLTPVPEPTTLLAGALLLLPFGMSTIRILRRRHTA